MSIVIQFNLNIWFPTSVIIDKPKKYSGTRYQVNISGTSLWMYTSPFSTMKIEKYMKSDLSSIFRLIAQNIVFGSPGTHFMHWGLKIFHKTEEVLKTSWEVTDSQDKHPQFNVHVKLKDKAPLSTFSWCFLHYFRNSHPV